MATSPKDKFDAAVKVIRGLPKNGSFQPSHELMLKFYSYFKQATEGPCTSPKPGFWDMVNRKKWDAWTKLGSMEPEEAMLLYVDELKNVSKFVREVYYPPEIVETMPQTDDVSEFLQKLENFYEMVEDSDNHNSLKAVDKETPPAADNGKSDRPLENSFNSTAELESEFEHSQGITQLLQQDIRWWQDRTGVMRANKSNGDINSDRRHHQPLNGKAKFPLKDEDDDADGEDEDQHEDNDINGTTNEKEGNEQQVSNSPGFDRLDEWEELEARASNSGSHSGQSGGSVSESETENEEFCDTSDEPAEEASVLLTQHHHTVTTSDVGSAATWTPVKPRISNITATPPPPPSSAASTAALAGAKSVHFDETDVAVTPLPQSNSSPVRQQMSDSLVVNPSPQAGNVLDLTTSGINEGNLEASTSVGAETMHWDSSYDAGKLDISVCRGGEEEEADRDRHSRRGTGGRGGRDAVLPGRGGGSHSGGSGGSGSRRGLFPGPGGGGGGGRGGPAVGMEDRSPADLNEQIVVTLLRLQHDMSGVLNRLNSLEALVKEGRAEKEKRAKAVRGWWPLSELSFKSALIIFGWPILLQIVLFCINRRRRRHAR